MLYWQFWASFWKNWAETASGRGYLPTSSTGSVDSLAAQTKYQYLTDYGRQVLCILNADHGCNYISGNFEVLTGNDIECCMGQDFYSVLHEDFHARLRELLATPTQKYKPHQLRCKLRHADGKYYWYVFAIHSKKGSDRDCVCIVDNVHDSMLIQNNLQKAKLEAELALRARSEFLANMSHDLRTPLNAVIGFAQLIESEMFGKIETPQYLEYVKHIQESGYDLLSKIEDLLEIANIDAGRITLDKEEVYLSDIIKHVVEAQAHHAGSANVVLEYQPRHGDMLLFVDRVKLQHILGHLVANAIKHSASGGKVELSVDMGKKQELLLRVSDNGVGMPKSKLSDILFALQQDNCWTDKNNNTIGIGLALTKEFVGLHGGTVDVSSKPGVGTSIEITLPADCIRLAPETQTEYARQAVN